MANKQAQELPVKRQAPPRANPHMAAYPDYTKSLVMQRHKSPTLAGIERGAQTGVTGAVLGALIARVLSDKLPVVAGGAALGGALAAVPGFNSGKREAQSDYSRLLFLRRRMGINEPGELDALLRHPEMATSLINKTGSAEKKAAMPPALLNILKGLGVAGAAAGGYQLGTEGTSRLLGYHDDPAARHLGGYVNAANAGALALALAMKGKHPQFAHAFMHPGTAGAMAGAEMIPSVLRTGNRIAASTETQGAGQIAPSLTRLALSNTGRGAAAGAGVAGVASILSGLTRAKTEEEIGKDKSRAGMVGADFLKYLLPSMIGGGVVGSLAKQQG